MRYRLVYIGRRCAKETCKSRREEIIQHLIWENSGGRERGVGIFMSFGGYEILRFLFYFNCDRSQCNWPHWCSPSKCCES